MCLEQKARKRRMIVAKTTRESTIMAMRESTKKKNIKKRKQERNISRMSTVMLNMMLAVMRSRQIATSRTLPYAIISSRNNLSLNLDFIENNFALHKTKTNTYIY